MNTYFFILTATAGHNVECIEHTKSGVLEAGPDATQASLFEEARRQWGEATGKGRAPIRVSYWSLVRNDLP